MQYCIETHGLSKHFGKVTAVDGLTIGVPQGPLVYAQIGKSPNVQFDARNYSWLGSANITSNTCVFTKRAGITTANDLITKTTIVGGSGGSTEFVPNLLNALVGTKFNIVKGYKSTNDVIPAMERGEVDGLCGWGWDSARVIGRDYFARGVFSVGIECANERHPDLAARGVPFMMDMAKDEETVYDFVSEMLATGSVSDPTFQRVKDTFGERGVVDLVGAVGYYSLVSMTLNVAQVPLPAGVTPPLK